MTYFSFPYLLSKHSYTVVYIMFERKILDAIIVPVKHVMSERLNNRGNQASYNAKMHWA